MHGEGHTDLGVALRRFRLTYLITVGLDHHPHVVVAGANIVRIAHTGPTTRRNVAACPTVTILCPPTEPDGYSLIIDGTGDYCDNVLVIVAEKAIMHRDNPSRAPGQRCGEECRRLTSAPPEIVVSG